MSPICSRINTLAHFRKTFLVELEDLFVQVLTYAQTMKLVKLGQISLDGTKIKANASKHKALSYGHIEKLEAQLREEVQALLARAAETGSKASDQINLTDEESRIMPSHEGFVQAYNGQVTVDVESMLIVAATLTQQTNDKQQVEPMLVELAKRENGFGKPNTLLADNGYFSQNNVKACVDCGITPLIALGRDVHHLPLDERLAADAPEPNSDDPVIKMAHALKTKQGRAHYGKRKYTVEPVFGIIKQIKGFRQFSLRGLQATSGEWKLITMAYNLKRMHVLAAG